MCAGSEGSQPIHPNTPNPYNIPSRPSTSTSPPASVELINNEEPRICSVRGCSLPLTPGATNKMCEACRGRHRIYASTKRARRKMEKAAVAGIRRMGEQQNGESSGVWAAAASSVPSAASATANVLAATWDKVTIDPQPYTESSTRDVDRLSAYQNTAYPTDSSSELAGALTLPTSTPGASSSASLAMHPTQSTAEHNISPHSSSSEGDSESDSEFDDQEEHEVSATLLTANSREIGGAAEDPPYTGTSRYCSVKGCKLVVSSEYTFKMCPSCRTRYRTYGNTKRAKWKAEREAFDRELAGMRTKEDERRRQAGERSLSDSPEDLRAWELSIVDEQVPLASFTPSTFVIGAHGGHTAENLGISEMPNLDGSINAKSELYADPISVGLARIPIPTLPPSAALPKPFNINTPQSTLSYPHPENPLLLTTLPIPQRMCTISHCHKILPSFYRYKRCEQHRLQNRHHSKLKRVREKVIKTTGLNGEEVEIMDDDGEETGKSEKENKTGKRQDENAGVEFAARDVELEYDTKDEDKPRKRNFICVSYGCHNLLGPAVRWRHCEICRARERVRKREKQELDSEGKIGEGGERNAQKEVERLREMVKRMAAGEKVDEAILDPEARASGSGPGQRDRGRGESADMFVEPDPASNTAHQTGLSKDATPTTVIAVDTPSTISAVASTNLANTPTSYIPAYKESPETFRSVFRATPVPFMFTPISNANDISDRVVASSDSAVPDIIGIQPTTSSLNTFGDINSSDTSRTGGKPLTFASTDTPLTFRAYKPKTATSAVGRLLAQNPDLSVQVFKDLLLPGKEKQVNTGLVGGSSYHVYKSTPPPTRDTAVFAPTIPTTPPFVYQPTQKKQRTYAINGSTEAPQNAEAQLEQESNSSTNDSRAYVDTSSANSSIATNAVASGSGPTPQSSTTPAPVLDTSPPSSVIPRKRASRAKPKPTPPPPPPPPSMPSPYSYTPHSQYPYPYYMSAPYSISPYGPHPSSSLSSAAHPPPPSSMPSSSVYSPYAALPGAYPYPYSPYGYTPTHPPPPGYPYPLPRYIPSPYGPPPLQPGQLYIPQQLHPGAYPSQYGYPKDTTFSYYHYPLEVQAAEVSGSKKKRKREKEVLSGKEPLHDSVLGLPSAIGQSTSRHNLPAAHLANGTVDPGTQTSDHDTDMTERKQQSEVVSVVVQMRSCGNKTCNRTIPTDTAGAMCEKCRVRLKKRQAKAKRRFKLEPRKSILNVKEGKKEDVDIDATIPAIPEVET